MVLWLSLTHRSLAKRAYCLRVKTVLKSRGSSPHGPVSLFGTVSEGDLGAIRRNLHILRINQVGLAHVVQESLSLINVSRARIAENRQTLNLIVSDMGASNEQIANVTQKLDNRIFQLETVATIVPTAGRPGRRDQTILAESSDLCGTPPAKAKYAEYR